MKKKIFILMVSIGIINFYNCSAADDIKQADAIGMTPLHTAITEEDLSKVEDLIKNGADLTCGNIVGMTPLHIAAQRGNTGAIRLLIQNGAPLNPLSRAQKTPLDYARMFNNRIATAILLEYGAQGTNLISRKRKKIGTFYLSHHADLKTKQRDISEEAILEALCNPQKKRIQENGILLYRGKEAEVVFDPRDNVILTVMPFYSHHK